MAQTEFPLGEQSLPSGTLQRFNALSTLSVGDMPGIGSVAAQMAILDLQPPVDPSGVDYQWGNADLLVYIARAKDLAAQIPSHYGSRSDILRSIDLGLPWNIIPWIALKAVEQTGSGWTLTVDWSAVAKTAAGVALATGYQAPPAIGGGAWADPSSGKIIPGTTTPWSAVPWSVATDPDVPWLTLPWAKINWGAIMGQPTGDVTQTIVKQLQEIGAQSQPAPMPQPSSTPHPGLYGLSPTVAPGAGLNKPLGPSTGGSSGPGGGLTKPAPHLPPLQLPGGANTGGGSQHAQDSNMWLWLIALLGVGGLGFAAWYFLRDSREAKLEHDAATDG